VQGIMFWNRYIANSTLSSIQSIKHWNISTQYYIVLFNTATLTIGKFSYNNLTVQLIFNDPNSVGNLLGPNSMALSGTTLYATVSSPSTGLLRIIAFDLNSF